MRAFGCAAALACSAAAAADAGSGLTLPGAHARDGDPASSLRGRFAFGLGAPAGLGATDGAFAAPPSLVSARLLGDYYFSRPAAGIGGRASGFRATSGVLLGSRLGAWAGAPGAAYGAASVSVERRNFGLLAATPGLAGRDDAGSTVPYVGIGYNDAFDKGRWGISADLGLMALRRSGSARLGATPGLAGADEQLRDLRLAPMLQLGVSYSF